MQISAPAPKVCKVNRVKALLAEFSDIFSEKFSTMTPKHGVSHDIETRAGPFTCWPRCLALEKLDAVKKEVLAMEAQGIIRQSSSPWGSPLLVVENKGGGIHPYGEFCLLNSVMRKDRYTLPLLWDFTHNLASMKCFITRYCYHHLLFQNCHHNTFWLLGFQSLAFWGV